MEQTPIDGALDATEKHKKVLEVLNIRSVNSHILKNLCLFVAGMTKCPQITAARPEQIDEYLDFLADHFRDVLWISCAKLFPHQLRPVITHPLCK
jgi:ribosomal protein L30/L7E